MTWYIKIALEMINKFIVAAQSTKNPYFNPRIAQYLNTLDTHFDIDNSIATYFLVHLAKRIDKSAGDINKLNELDKIIREIDKIIIACWLTSYSYYRDRPVRNLQLLMNLMPEDIRLDAKSIRKWQFKHMAVLQYRLSISLRDIERIVSQCNKPCESKELTTIQRSLLLYSRVNIWQARSSKILAASQPKKNGVQLDKKLQELLCELGPKTAKRIAKTFRNKTLKKFYNLYQQLDEAKRKVLLNGYNVALQFLDLHFKKSQQQTSNRKGKQKESKNSEEFNIAEALKALSKEQLVIVLRNNSKGYMRLSLKLFCDEEFKMEHVKHYFSKNSQEQAALVALGFELTKQIIIEDKKILADTWRSLDETTLWLLQHMPTNLALQIIEIANTEALTIKKQSLIEFMQALGIEAKCPGLGALLVEKCDIQNIHFTFTQNLIFFNNEQLSHLNKLIEALSSRENSYSLLFDFTHVSPKVLRWLIDFKDIEVVRCYLEGTYISNEYLREFPDRRQVIKLLKQKKSEDEIIDAWRKAHGMYITIGMLNCLEPKMREKYKQLDESVQYVLTRLFHRNLRVFKNFITKLPLEKLSKLAKVCKQWESLVRSLKKFNPATVSKLLALDNKAWQTLCHLAGDINLNAETKKVLNAISYINTAELNKLLIHCDIKQLVKLTKDYQISEQWMFFQVLTGCSKPDLIIQKFFDENADYADKLATFDIKTVIWLLENVEMQQINYFSTLPSEVKTYLAKARLQNLEKVKQLLSAEKATAYYFGVIEQTSMSVEPQRNGYRSNSPGL